MCGKTSQAVSEYKCIYVRRYCEWAESSTHDVETARELLLALMAGAPALKSSDYEDAEPRNPGLPHKVVWPDTKRYDDFPFQIYHPSYWRKGHPEGLWTDNIHENFAHIHAELLHGLEKWEKGDRSCAVTYWRDSFHFNWGNHASAAVWAIEQHEQSIKNG